MLTTTIPYPVVHAERVGMRFVPFSKRHNQAERERYEALVSGVPEGLRGTLLSVVVSAIRSEWNPHRVADEHFHRLSRIFGMQFPDSLSDAVRLLSERPGLLLDVVDYCLRYGEFHAWGHPEQLKAALLEARSVYTVGFNSDRYWELLERQPQELTDLMEQTMSSRDEASARLTEAWSKCFSRTPDLDAACHAAVQAVEAAAKPVVIPNDPVATLGKIIKAMQAKPEKWVTAADNGVAVAITMATSVWEDFQRHGGDANPTPMTQELAEMIVHTAVLLVHWFQSGHIKAAS